MAVDGWSHLLVAAPPPTVSSVTQFYWSNKQIKVILLSFQRRHKYFTYRFFTKKRWLTDLAPSCVNFNIVDFFSKGTQWILNKLCRNRCRGIQSCQNGEPDTPGDQGGVKKGYNQHIPLLQWEQCWYLNMLPCDHSLGPG